MATYKITEKQKYHSNEVYFDSKPEPEVLAALKALKMRWNPRIGCWYGFASQDAIRSAIGSNDNDIGGVVSDGYMGALRWDGNKSHLHLYGSDLSRAIRDDLKRHGIRGCTVSCNTYSGGQSLKIKVSATPEDFVDREAYISQYRPNDAGYWLYTEDGEQIHIDTWYTLDGDEQKRTLRSHAARSYDYTRKNGTRINNYYIDRYTEYTETFREKLHKINAVLDTYNYDDSNGMVDYFDTNFYRDIFVKAVS